MSKESRARPPGARGRVGTGSTTHPSLLQVGTKQIIPPSCQIIKVKEIQASVTEVTGTAGTDSVVVQGTLHLQIFYVGSDNIVRLQQEDVPFRHLLYIPGTTPGMSVTTKATVEFVVYHLDPARAVLKKKIVLLLEASVTTPAATTAAGGPLILEAVVGQASEQILVEVTNVFPCIIKERIRVGGAQEISEQILLEKSIPVQAIKIKSIGTELVDVTYQVLPDVIIVTGVLHKQIYLVGPDNIVRLVEEDIPFSRSLAFPGLKPGDFVQVDVQVEFVIPELNPSAGTLRQKVVLKILVTAISPTVDIDVVVDVFGPGIVTEKVKIRVDSTVLSVVTAVSGPGVKNVVKKVIYVDVVDDGNPNPVPLEVVVDLTIDP